MATTLGRQGTEAEGNDLFRITQQSIPEAELGAGSKPPKSQSNEQAHMSHLSSKTGEGQICIDFDSKCVFWREAALGYEFPLIVEETVGLWRPPAKPILSMHIHIFTCSYLHVRFKLGGPLGIPKLGFSSCLLLSSYGECHLHDRVPEGRGCPVM